MKALVTGGGGFVGSRLVELLSARGDAVTFLARSRYPRVEALDGVRGLQVDLRDAAAVAEACIGQDVVFHLAALAAPWGRREDFYEINVEGTRHVIDGCRAAGVPKLVYCSTPSVIGYLEDVEHGGPDIPYATHFVSLYQETKAKAEQMTLAANGDGLATVALRPHVVIGPGEKNMIPRLVQKARAGRLPQIGDGSALVDLTVVDNAAWAHIDAAAALTSPEAVCAGKAYFITNGEPVRTWDWIRDLLNQMDLPGPSRILSFSRALRAAKIVEFVWRLFRLRGEPPITQLQVVGMGKTHTFDIGPAQRDLGYSVRVSVAEATAQIVASVRAES
jgi:nucleoside-diphosphate-sugar epimerase